MIIWFSYYVRAGKVTQIKMHLIKCLPAALLQLVEVCKSFLIVHERLHKVVLLY